MEFTHFPKMENLEVAKAAGTPNYVAAQELDTKWTVTEKIDGANISLHCTRDKCLVGQRNGFADDGFYNVGKELYKVNSLIAKLRSLLFYDTSGELEHGQISVYGEFFGQKIMNRLHYGMTSQFRFYAMRSIRTDGTKRWHSWNEFVGLMEKLDESYLVVPVLASGLTFEEACAFANDQKSRLCEDDTMEGVVLWPEAVPAFDGGKVLAFKNKNEAFLETSTRKVHTPLTEAEQEANALNALFREYCTESRMWSVFSKLGKPKNDKADAGKYIVARNDDAWEDFIIDHPEAALFDKPGIKRIRNIGSLAYTLFKTVQVKNENN